MNKKGFANFILIGVIVALVAVGALGYLIWSQKSKPVVEEPVQVPVTAQTNISELPKPTTLNSTSDLKTYIDRSNGFSFQYLYSGDFTVDSKTANMNDLSNSGKNNDWLQLVNLQKIPSVKYFFSNTTLADSRISVGYSPSASEQDCKEASDNLPSGTIAPMSPYNNIKWYKGFQPGGSSNGVSDVLYYLSDSYQTYHNNACWAVNFFWMWGGGYRDGNTIVPPTKPQPNETDMKNFEQSILNTFKFTK